MPKVTPAAREAAMLRKLKVETEVMLFDLAVKKKDYIKTADAFDIVKEIFTEVVVALHNIPKKIAPLINSSSTTPEIETLIRDEIEYVMGKLALNSVEEFVDQVEGDGKNNIQE